MGNSMGKDKRDIPNMSIYGGNNNWVTKDSNPTGGGRNGYGGNSNDSGSYGGGSTSTSYGNNSIRSSIDSSSASSTYKSIIELTTGAKHGKYLLGERIINLQNGSLTNDHIGVLMQHLQYQGLNLDKFDFSYNKLGYGAVENIFYTFSLQRSNTALYNIKFINLSNNQIGDDGAKYIASHVGNGNYPNLKALDVSGNQISINGSVSFIESMQSSSCQEVAIKTHDNSSSKTVWQFLTQAFNYYADKYYKHSSAAEKAWVSLYGNNEWSVCKKYLQETGKVISAGFIKKISDPKALSLLSKSNTLPQKLIVSGGIFLQVIKDESKDIFLSPDLMQCIGVINSKFSTDINDYTKELIGNTSNDFIFE